MALEDKFLEELEKGQKFTQGVSILDLFFLQITRIKLSQPCSLDVSH